MDSSEKLKPTVTRQNTLLRRIGWQSALILLLSMLATLAVLGFLGFLWYAEDGNTLWHKIMIEGWSTRAVSISTLVLRFVIDLQAGIAGAMLAAIIMESSSVVLHDVAMVSTMRAGTPQPRAILGLIPAIFEDVGTVPGFSTLGECNDGSPMVHQRA